MFVRRLLGGYAIIKGSMQILVLNCNGHLCLVPFLMSTTIYPLFVEGVRQDNALLLMEIW